MLSLLPTSLTSNGLLEAVRTAPPAVYLLLAALLLLIALRVLRSLRRAFMPLGALLQTVTATFVVTITVGLALVLLAAAAVSTH